jgi:hypothetical protein
MAAKFLAGAGLGAAGFYFYTNRPGPSKAPEIPKTAPYKKNSAFVFVKPHANNTAAQKLVVDKFNEKGINILTEGELTAEQIDAGMLIDQHYYAIASKATILEPRDIPVPVDKFKEAFGLSWEQALSDGVVYNALGACKKFGLTSDELNEYWQKSSGAKFGGGFYCRKLEIPGNKPVYVFNGFFMSMRNEFVKPGTSIHYYTVEFEPEKLSWEDFRGKVLGPTAPKDGPEGSLRGTLYRDWKKYGLSSEPNTGENGFHASASPFEGLAERMNWLSIAVGDDPFGRRLLDAGVPAETIEAWSRDPRVKGASLFDQLEDLDVDACVEKCVELSK